MLSVAGLQIWMGKNIHIYIYIYNKTILFLISREIFLNLFF